MIFSCTLVSMSKCTYRAFTFLVSFLKAVIPVSLKKTANPRLRKSVPWTREEKIAVMKHFKKHIFSGRLASVLESRRCQLLEPVLNGRSIQKIRDFVRNAGLSLRNSRADRRQPENPDNPKSVQSTNILASSEPSTHTENSTSLGIVPSPATASVKPIFILSQTAHATDSTTLPPQASISAPSDVAHPEPRKILYINVQAHQSAKQITASLQLPSQAAHPSIIPASTAVLPPTANPNIFSADATTPQVACLANSSILIPQVPNHTVSSVLLPQVAPLISTCILVPQVANPFTYNLLTAPGANATLLPPETAMLKGANISFPPAPTENLPQAR